MNNVSSMNPHRPTNATGRYVDAIVDGEQVRAFVPDPLPPAPPLTIEGQMLSLFGEASVALGGLEMSAQQLPDLDVFLYSYVRKEALLSSQIEGTRSTLSEFLEHELAGAPGMPRDDVVEVSNHVAALNLGSERLDALPLSNRLIREMHRQLLRSGRGASHSPGEFRRGPVWIGARRARNARFVPPPWKMVPELMGQLESFLHDTDDGIPPLIRAGLAHVQFETIHPFSDGNGRTGRILITIMLIARGILRHPLLYLSLYFKNYKDEYFDLLDSVRVSGSWLEWLEFFLTGVRETANGAIDTTRRLQAMFESDQHRIQQIGRRASTVLRVHRAFMNRPLLNIKEAANRAGVSIPGVSAAVGTLEEQGIVQELTGRRRNRIFKYTKYLDVLSEGTEPL